jgi:hypothetical protein
MVFSRFTGVARFVLAFHRMPRVVALVSTEPDEALVRYLGGAGFAVRGFRTPLGAPREGTLVWLADHATNDHTIVDTVRRWLGAKAKLRAIVVTDRPARLKEAAADARGRVWLLPAPVFGWQLVDALRDQAVVTP